MGLLKFLLVTLAILLLIRIIIRMLLPVRIHRAPNTTQNNPTSSSVNVDKPRFTIEAEVVDYEIIDEKKDEK